MTTSYSVSRPIDAPAPRAWALLVDASTYPAWNRAVVSIQGSIVSGGTVTLVSVANPKRTFTLTVSEVDAPHRMVWRGGMPLGLFMGIRTYVLDDVGSGCVFTMTEEYSGLLASMITRSIPDLTESFGLFADSLKTAAERPAT